MCKTQPIYLISLKNESIFPVLHDRQLTARAACLIKMLTKVEPFYWMQSRRATASRGTPIVWRPLRQLIWLLFCWHFALTLISTLFPRSLSQLIENFSSPNSKWPRQPRPAGPRPPSPTRLDSSVPVRWRWHWPRASWRLGCWRRARWWPVPHPMPTFSCGSNWTRIQRTTTGTWSGSATSSSWPSSQTCLTGSWQISKGPLPPPQSPPTKNPRPRPRPPPQYQQGNHPNCSFPWWQASPWGRWQVKSNHFTISMP